MQTSLNGNDDQEVINEELQSEENSDINLEIKELEIRENSMHQWQQASHQTLSEDIGGDNEAQSDSLSSSAVLKVTPKKDMNEKSLEVNQTRVKEYDTQPAKRRRKASSQRRQLSFDRDIKSRNSRKDKKFKRTVKTQRKTRKNHITSSLSGDGKANSNLGMIEAEEILSLGKQLGLDPIYSDNDTLSVIKKRLSRT